MMKKTLLRAFLPLCFTIPALAGEMGPTSHQYFVSISAGPSWATPGETQAIALQPDVVNTYLPQTLNRTNKLVNGELFVGVQRYFFKQILSQFGVDGYFSDPVTLRGYIQVDGDPNFQNYAYQYKVKHEHIALKSKWVFEPPLNINPYISGSLGVGFNRSSQYAITPLIFQAVPMPAFQSKTQTALTYSVGAGFQRTLNPHLTAAIGYQLVSWGTSHLNPASGQTTSQGIHLNHLYTQGIEFNISYLL